MLVDISFGKCYRYLAVHLNPRTSVPVESYDKGE